MKITVTFNVQPNAGYSERKLPESFHQYLLDMLYVGVKTEDDYFWVKEALIDSVEDE